MIANNSVVYVFIYCTLDMTTVDETAAKAWQYFMLEWGC